MREDEGIVLGGKHAALDVVNVAAAQLVEIAHVAVGGGAAAARLDGVTGTEPQGLQHDQARVLDALVIVGDGEVTDVVHLPRGHATPTRVDPGLGHGR